MASKSVWISVARVLHEVPAHGSRNALQSVWCCCQELLARVVAASAAQSAPSFTSVSALSVPQKETDRACLPPAHTLIHTTRQQQGQDLNFF